MTRQNRLKYCVAAGFRPRQMPKHEARRRSGCGKQLSRATAAWPRWLPTSSASPRRPSSASARCAAVSFMVTVPSESSGTKGWMQQFSHSKTHVCHASPG